MAQALNELASKLQGLDYKPLSEEEILMQSQNQYKNLYDQQVLGAQQAYDTGEQAYGKQLDQVALSHDRQIEQVKEQTKYATSTADRNALTRGMQRSSYNLATLSNIQLAGDKAQVSIGEARTRAEFDIAEQRTLKAQQLAQTLQQARNAYETNVLTYADKLRDREAQRMTDATRYQNEIAMALYDYQNRAEQQQQQYNQWLMEFNENVRQFETNYQLKVDQMNAPAKKSTSKSSSKSVADNQTTGDSGSALPWANITTGVANVVNVAKSINAKPKGSSMSR